MYNIESRFKNRIIAGTFGAMTFIYFFNNPDNFNAIKVRISSTINESFNFIAELLKQNLYQNKLVTSTITLNTNENDSNENDSNNEDN